MKRDESGPIMVYYDGETAETIARLNDPEKRERDLNILKANLIRLDREIAELEWDELKGGAKRLSPRHKSQKSGPWDEPYRRTTGRQCDRCDRQDVLKRHKAPTYTIYKWVCRACDAELTGTVRDYESAMGKGGDMVIMRKKNRRAPNMAGY